MLTAALAACTSAHTATGGPLPDSSQAISALPYGSRYHLPPEFAQWERGYQEGIERYVKDHQPKGLGEPPADVRFIRFTEPDEYNVVYRDCMSRQGFAVTITDDGGISFGDYPADQTPALLEADFRCLVQYPLNPRYTVPLTDTQIRIIYDYYVGELVACLDREGYRIDRTGIPTRETFVATFNDPGSWSPYEVVTKAENDAAAANGGVVPRDWQDEWTRINKACPQNPPLDRLYPSR